ncbi:hypothetical protein ABFO19_17435 [Xanthomonas citri pv. glycines]|uniref:Uncharacterized protein n=1 Tax=Xanthomonas campestris pv. glycines TaxID=473421 RepID=A0AAX0I557_XANCG|nr:MULTISPECIES: hypothetical protein [Xanthomonas]AOY61976.1 hypothetical protein BHE84_07295 [Xanthomonas citri pv. glycines str. 8ra]ARV24353.1 hypothetical protein A9D66_17550 [Xanthomonas citri pv. glycines str. 12-2]OEY98798.1 hypothetical protein BIY41_06985 [Xanthomonas citri pv. glycines]OOX01661.1 hypothetical protein Xgly_17355 [Xanthomonas citri pv. glycines]QDR46400.1 hypothetical protein FPK90_18515 [Xanthomonas citri pv. glycines]
MHHQTQIQVASRLLGHLLQQRTTRLPPHEVEDIQYALDLAAELLRLGGPGPAGQTQASTMAPSQPILVKRAAVDRSVVPTMPASIEEWREARKKKNKDKDNAPRPKEPIGIERIDFRPRPRH